MGFLFRDEISNTLSEIKEEFGGYDNNGRILMPKSRFFLPFDNFDDLKSHIKTIIQSLFQIFNKSLPALSYAVSSLFKSFGYLLLLDFKQAKENSIQSLTYLWFSMVITGVLTLNMGLHGISLVTRSLKTGMDGIGRQCFTPSTL